MPKYHAKLGKNGRIVIPAQARHALELHEGDNLLVEVQENRIVLHTEAALLERLHHAAGSRAEDELPSEELIRERREEARREKTKAGS